jgi:hypothetical protein
MIGWPASAGRTIRATPNAAATLAKARIRLRATKALPSNVPAMPACTRPAGGQWNALALAALEDGPVRFGAIKARLEGISPKGPDRGAAPVGGARADHPDRLPGGPTARGVRADRLGPRRVRATRGAPLLGEDNIERFPALP